MAVGVVVRPVGVVEEGRPIVGVYIVMVCQWTDHILARNPLLEVEADLS